MNHLRLVLAALAASTAAALGACAPSADPPPSTPPPPAPVAATPSPEATGIDAFGPGARAAAEGIRPEALAAHIRFLADDLLEGREPGTRGFELGSHYVASQLQELGLVPAGDKGTFFQPVEMLGHKLKSSNLVFEGGSGPPLRMVADKDFVAAKEDSDVSAEMVFVGYGLDVPEFHYDDFAGVDLHGKVVVFFFQAPHTERPDFFPPLASALFGDRDRKLADLKRRGASALVGVVTPELAKIFPWPALVTHFHFETMLLPDSKARIPGAVIGMAGLDRLLRKAGRRETAAELVETANHQASRAFSFGGVKAKLRVEVTERKVLSENVVAYVPSDPSSATRDEMIVYGAHLDHMGIGDPVKGDSIYNGASDDAAGCSSLLETARAFTQLAHAQPLRRKILFTFVTGEERGLLGSQWFAEHPTVPITSIVADIDVDAAYPIAPIKDVVPNGAEESSLAVDAARAAHALGLEIGHDAHPEQFDFIRSDQYSFVKKGIPAAQIMQGELGMSKEEKERTDAFWQGRYHQPQDEYEPQRDWRPFAQTTRFNFLLGLSIAQRAERPTWNANSFFRRFPEKEAR
jgi:Zn-dependent M28 family amino/carboxypeptidase